MFNQIELTKVTVERLMPTRPRWRVNTSITAPNEIRPIPTIVNEKISVRDQRWPSLTALLIVMAAFAVSLILTMEITRLAETLPIIWLGNGVQAGALLLTSRRHWWIYATLFLVVGTLILLLYQYPLSTAAGSSVINLLESLFVAYILARDPEWIDGRTDRLRSWVRFAWWGVIVAPALAACAGDLMVAYARGLPIGIIFWEWYINDALGMCVLLPMILRLRPVHFANLRREGRLLETLAIVLFFTVLTVAIFAQSAVLTLFAFIPVLAIVLFRIGFVGVVACTGVLTVASLSFTIAHQGPLLTIAEASLPRAILLMQIFVMIIFATLVVIAALLDERQSLQQMLRQNDALHIASAQREALLLREKNDALEGEMRERQNAEQAMIQAQKLESLSILAGGIAHDFNNLLTVMISQSSLVQIKLGEGHAVSKNIDKALGAMGRAATLAKQMLAYSGKGHFQLARYQLHDLVGENQILLTNAINGKAELLLDLAPRDFAIQADPAQISQLLVDLILNAVEAEAKTIRLTTTFSQIDETDTQYWQYTNQPLTPGYYTMLSVADDGAGMEEETRMKLFDPFYSTKFVGRGLGLAAILGIVRGHQGGISFVSEPGQGSTFTLLFPHLDPLTNALANPATQEHVIDMAKVKKTLVIDDEADVRDVLEDFLTYYGVQVLQAASGMAGLEILRGDLQAVDLVILDLSMPGMNGVETLSHIRQLTTQLPVIISSGYSQQKIETQLAQDPQIRFLGKPYTYPQLCQTIESLLN